MTKLDHIAMVVADLDKAVALYRDGFGLELDRIEDLPARGVRVAFLSLGDTHVELVQSLRDDSEIAAWAVRHGEGMHHVALAVSDIEAALAGAEAAGASRVKGSEGTGAGGSRVAFLHPRSTAGVLLELVEHGEQ